MSEVHFLPIFFKLLNFAVFATAIGWAIKRYGIPFLQESMISEAAEKQRLQDEAVFYSERAEASAHDFIKQNEQYAFTIQKMNQWIQQVEQERAQFYQQQEQLFISISQIKTQQEHARVSRAHVQKLLPQVLIATEQKLIKECSDLDCQKKYLAPVFEYMKKS